MRCCSFACFCCGLCAVNDGHTGAGPGAPGRQGVGDGLGPGFVTCGDLERRVGLGLGAGRGDFVFDDVGDGVGRGDVGVGVGVGDVGDGVGVGDVGDGVGVGEVGDGVGVVGGDDEGSGVGDTDVGLGLGVEVTNCAAMAAGQNATAPATIRPGTTIRQARAILPRPAAADVERRNPAAEMMTSQLILPPYLCEPLQAD
jgi:hypothetical protein